MVFVSVTRLRIRSVRFLPAFLLHSARAVRQIERAPGFRGGALLADRGWAFWTVTAWDDQQSMRSSLDAGAHRAAMPRVSGWCDEASVVHWEQPDGALPTWDEADGRMRREGRPTPLRHAGPHHRALTYRRPRPLGTTPIRPAGG